MNTNSHYNSMSGSATANYWGVSSGQVSGAHPANASSQYYASQPAYSQQSSQQTSYQHHYSQHQQPASQYGQPAYQTQSALNTVPSQSSVGQYIPYIPQQQSVQHQHQAQLQYQPQQKQGQYQPQQKQGLNQSQYKQGHYQPQERQGQYQPQHRQEQYNPQPQGHFHQQRANRPALSCNTSMSHHRDSSGNVNNFGDRPQANEYRDLKERTINTCREFMKGFCTKSEERCRFAHPPPFVDVKNGKVIVCFDFVKNRCQRTQPPCKYMHPPRHLWPEFGSNGTSDGAPRNAPRVNDCNAGSYGYDQRGQHQNRDMGRMDYGARNGPQRTFQGDGQRTNEIGACRDFLRNNCTRRECKFAHPPPHVKVVNGRVTYCFNYLKGSCQREDCKYFHMPEHLSARFGRNEFRGQKRTHDMRDDRKDGDNLPTADYDKHAHYVPEMPQESTVHASESATKHADFEDADNVKEDCLEKEILESDADGTTMQETFNTEKVETAKDEEIEVELGNENEFENLQAGDEEFEDVRGDEEVENDDYDDDGSHLEGPPRKRIALDSDYVEE